MCRGQDAKGNTGYIETIETIKIVKKVFTAFSMAYVKNTLAGEEEKKKTVVKLKEKETV